jgi:hypothetical protein
MPQIDSLHRPANCMTVHQVIVAMADVLKHQEVAMYALRATARLVCLLRFRSAAPHAEVSNEVRQHRILSGDVTRFPLSQAAVPMGCPYCGANPSYILRSRLRWYDYAVFCIVRGLRCGSCWRRFYAMRSWLRKPPGVFTAPTEFRPVSKFSTPNASPGQLKTADFQVHHRRNEKATA